MDLYLLEIKRKPKYGISEVKEVLKEWGGGEQ